MSSARTTLFFEGSFELKDDQPIDRVEAVVICRGAEQTGFLGKAAVPLCWSAPSKSCGDNLPSL